jgi:Ca2+:H+ antiporter
VARRLLGGGLLLAPIVIILRFATEIGDVPLFALSAVALVPLAWLIGDATEHAAEHTGPGIGGFLNASFGNAPELIIALFAISDGLPNVVRGSLAGSVVGNLLLVLGVALVVRGEDRFDRPSMLQQLGLVLAAVLLFLIPSVPGWHGNPDRHSLAIATLPVAIVLMALYLGATAFRLRRAAHDHSESTHEPSAEGWSLRTSLAVLGVATVATAFVSETLVKTLDAFAHAAGLSQFFIAAVIVAIVGNASEHGGAVLIAHRGKMSLASEIAVSSSAQVALLVAPAAALLSWLVKPALPLTFRPVELATMGGAVILVALVVRDARSRRWEGWMLLAAYAVAAVGFYVVGDR